MRALGLSLGLCVALASCASSATKSAVDRLGESVEAYNHAFRWKNYERAALFLPNDQRSAYLAAYEDDEASLQVEEFAVRNVEMIGTTRAKVSIRVTYLLLPSVKVENRTLVQHWAEVNGVWLLEHEDNSIRSLDPAKQPRDPRARPPAPVPHDPRTTGPTDVQTERPGDVTTEGEEINGDPDEP